MDLSSYIEPEFEAKIKKFANTEGVNADDKEEPAPAAQAQAPPELTEEEKNLKFFDFAKSKEFVGTFLGPGQTYSYSGSTVLTWSFKDINGLPWLTPQWMALDKPQGSFKGFSAENPEEKYLYKLIYINSAEGNHQFTIFRKRSADPGK